MARPWVVLDRDGTIIEDRHYLSEPDGVALLPGAVEGLSRLRQAGLPMVVITNQSGIGRGYFGVEEMHRVNRRLDELLKAHDLVLEGYYFCPHSPDEGCSCRKPATELLLRAAQDLGLRPRDAFVVGDKESDRQLGLAVGGQGFLLGRDVADLRGFAERVLAQIETSPL